MKFGGIVLQVRKYALIDGVVFLICHIILTRWRPWCSPALLYVQWHPPAARYPAECVFTVPVCIWVVHDPVYESV